MNFEWALNAWIGNLSPICVHAERCRRSIVIEHNGDVYACDHCVYPEYKLGNILTDSLLQIAEKSIQSGFGITKETALPRWCKECEVLGACRAAVRNIALQDHTTANRGFIISVQDTRSFSSTFGST